MAHNQGALKWKLCFNLSSQRTKWALIFLLVTGTRFLEEGGFCPPHPHPHFSVLLSNKGQIWGTLPTCVLKGSATSNQVSGSGYHLKALRPHSAGVTNRGATAHSETLHNTAVQYTPFRPTAELLERFRLKNYPPENRMGYPSAKCVL